jgi:hypothetical protein
MIDPWQKSPFEQNAVSSYIAGKQAKILQQHGMQENQTRDLEIGSRLAQSVMSVPDSQKASAYKSAIEYAKTQGLSVAGLPTEYNKDIVDPSLKSMIGLGKSAQATLLEQEAEKERVFKAQENKKNNAVDWARLAWEKEKAKAMEGKSDPDTAMKLMKEWNSDPNVKTFSTTRDSYNKIKTIATSKPSAAGDLSMIFAYMKTLDPGSVVREGEFATAQNTTGVSGKVINQYNKILSGERLSPEQRKDFFNQASGIYKSQKQGYDKAKSEYSRIAGKYGVDPSMVILEQDYGTEEDKQKATAQAQRALQSGADPAQVNAKLQQMGVPPIEIAKPQYNPQDIDAELKRRGAL